MTKDYNCDTISRQAVEGDGSLIEHPEIFSDMEWLNKTAVAVASEVPFRILVQFCKEFETLEIAG